MDNRTHEQMSQRRGGMVLDGPPQGTWRKLEMSGETSQVKLHLNQNLKGE